MAHQNKRMLIRLTNEPDAVLCWHLTNNILLSPAKRRRSQLSPGSTINSRRSWKGRDEINFIHVVYIVYFAVNKKITVGGHLGFLRQGDLQTEINHLIRFSTSELVENDPSFMNLHQLVPVLSFAVYKK